MLALVVPDLQAGSVENLEAFPADAGLVVTRLATVKMAEAPVARGTAWPLLLREQVQMERAGEPTHYL